MPVYWHIERLTSVPDVVCSRWNRSLPNGPEPASREEFSMITANFWKEDAMIESY